MRKSPQGRWSARRANSESSLSAVDSARRPCGTYHVRPLHLRHETPVSPISPTQLHMARMVLLARMVSTLVHEWGAAKVSGRSFSLGRHGGPEQRTTGASPLRHRGPPASPHQDGQVRTGAIGATMEWLGEIPSCPRAMPEGINASGQVVGWCGGFGALAHVMAFDPPRLVESFTLLANTQMRPRRNA